jgi:hypothetical protein
MGKLPIVVLLALFFTVALSSSAFAQGNRSQRTGSARAAYGEPVYSYSTKKKAKHNGKKTRRKAARKKDAAPINRNRTKSPWVN